MNSIQKRIYLYAIASRVILIFFSALANILIVDHIPTDVFQGPDLSLNSNGVFDDIVNFFFGGLMRWDAQHFLHIAQHGYTYENNLAFFPMFPLVVRCIYYIISPLLLYVLNPASCLLLISVSLNCMIFPHTAVLLYTLTMEHFKDLEIAFTAAISLCVSPASVFFIAPYSEVMYLFCVLNGMLNYSRRNVIYSCFWFGLSSFVRSNGILNSGFSLHLLGFLFIDYLSNHRFLSRKTFKILGMSVCSALFCSVVIILPYLMFQLFGHFEFCRNSNNVYPTSVINYALKHNLSMPFHKTDWCENTFPLPYTSIQNKYWNVGFLQYYTIKQIPNFLLASPIIYIILSFGLRYLYRNWNLLFDVPSIYRSVAFSNVRTAPESIFVYVVHSVFLTCFCILFINIQVTTRMLASSNPALYWIAALDLVDTVKNSEKSKRRLSKASQLHNKYNILTILYKHNSFIKWYFVSCLIAGIVMFSNNLPWS